MKGQGVSDSNKMITVQEYMEQHPGVSLDAFTSEGYLFITPESFQQMLKGKPFNVNPGCSGCDWPIEADFVLGMEFHLDMVVPDPKRVNVMCVMI